MIKICKTVKNEYHLNIDQTKNLILKVVENKFFQHRVQRFNSIHSTHQLHINHRHRKSIDLFGNRGSLHSTSRRRIRHLTRIETPTQ